MCRNCASDLNEQLKADNIAWVRGEGGKQKQKDAKENA